MNFNTRMSSMTTRRSINMRPLSSATSIDGSEEVYDSRRKQQAVGGWQMRKSNLRMETMAEEYQEEAGQHSDAESIESLSSRARFMSEMLSDSDSSIDGRGSFDGGHTATTVSSFDGPRTPTSPAPEYTDTGFPMVEIVDEKSPRASYEMALAFQEKMKEMQTTVGPRGPHLFRSSFSEYGTTPPPFGLPQGIVMPPTPSASNASRSPVEPLSPVAMAVEPIMAAPPTPPSDAQLIAAARPKSVMSQVISEYDLEEVRSWTPAQVCVWMAELGFDRELVEKFGKNDITGAILVDLKWEDLKELDIQSFGKRIELWTEIHHLRARTVPTPDLPGAEFVRSSSRVSRKTSVSSKSSRGSRRTPQGLQKIVREVGHMGEPSGKALPDLPTLLNKRLSLRNSVISEADEASEASGPARRHARPQLRKKARKTNVRIPRRQISVDSFIITSGDDDDEYIRQLRAVPSVDGLAAEEHIVIHPRRTRSRRSPKEDSLLPNDSVSIRGGGSRKHKCKKHHHHHSEDHQGKPHRCSKGEKCPRFGKISRSSKSSTKRSRSRSPPRTGTILIATTPSIADPSFLPRLSALDPDYERSPRPQSYGAGSVLASSDVLGPVHGQEVRLQESALREIARVDPLENVKQFLTHQHLQHLEERRESPPPVPTKSHDDIVRARSTLPPTIARPISPPAPVSRNECRTAPPTQNRFIPTPPSALGPAPLPTPSPSPPRTQTPSFGLRSQGMERAAPPHLNFSNPSRLRTPSRNMTTTPFSEADVPAPCATPVDRLQQSQSVPPDLHYRRYPTPTLQTLTHGRRGTQWPTVQPLTMTAVDENAEWEEDADENGMKMAPSPHMRTHSGWMKKRRTNWFRHEWPDYHFVLKGTRLGYAKDVATGEVGAIDMEDYQVACSNSGSTKLSAAFKAGRIFGKKKDAQGGTYFFQLVPGSGPGIERSKKASGKVHYFAVGSREERIDWMRELMLAKAIKQKKQGFEVEVNGTRM